MGRGAALLFLALTAAGSAVAVGDRRIIVAFGDPGSPAMQALQRGVDAQRCRLVERDVDVRYVDVTELRASADRTLERLAALRDPDAGPFELVLVGKDGGVKERAADPAALTGFFDTIDGMPVRRAEIRRAGGADVRCGPGRDRDPAPTSSTSDE